MKILHVITSLETGGAEKLMSILLPQLKAYGNDVQLLLFDGHRTPLYDEIESKGIKIHTLSIGKSVYSLSNIFKLIKYIGEYDIIHTHNTACQLFVPIAKTIKLPKRKSCILVTTEHNSTNRRRGNRLFRIIDKWMYSQYSKIICIAQNTADNLNAYISTTYPKTEIICNGIDISLYSSIQSGKPSNSDEIITMIAGFRKQKNQGCLVRALTHLPDKYRVRFAGDGERRKEVENLAQELGVNERVEFLGIRSDIPEILKSSSINILSSHWEGLSLSSLECMASGRPFIASDVDGLHDIVKDAGILFPDSDDKELARQIRQLSENKNLYIEIGRRCRERAMEYDISKTAESYNNVYKKLINQ